MTSACPSCRPSGSNTIRATMSIVLPAVNGMITRIGLVGQLCAQLTRGGAGVMAAAAMSCRWRRRVCFKDVPPLIRHESKAARTSCLTLESDHIRTISQRGPEPCLKRILERAPIASRSSIVCRDRYRLRAFSRRMTSVSNACAFKTSMWKKSTISRWLQCALPIRRSSSLTRLIGWPAMVAFLSSRKRFLAAVI